MGNCVIFLKDGIEEYNAPSIHFKYILKIVFNLITGLYLVLTVYIWKSMYSKRNERNIGEQTNIDVVKEIFPGLEGIDKVCWEVNDFSTNYIDVSEYQDDIWYYSTSFNKAVLSDTMMGKIYFNGNEMWFEVIEN